MMRKVEATATSPLEISTKGSAAMTPHVTNDKTKQIYPNTFFKMLIPLYSYNVMLS